MPVASPESEIISEVDLQSLHLEFARTQDPRIAKQLISQYEGIAHSISRSMARRPSEKEDVEQTAMFALFKALQRFDPRRGVRFSTFAWRTVEGEVKRYFRDNTTLVHIPRPLQERVQYVARGIDDLTHELGRPPSIPEISKRLCLLEDEVIEAVEAQRARSTRSIDHSWDEGSEPFLDGFPSSSGSHEFADTRQDLHKALMRLPEKERTIVFLRFFEDMSQTQIAAHLGISQMHVSRLLSRACTRLRSLSSQ